METWVQALFKLLTPGKSQRQPRAAPNKRSLSHPSVFSFLASFFPILKPGTLLYIDCKDRGREAPVLLPPEPLLPFTCGIKRRSSFSK